MTDNEELANDITQIVVEYTKRAKAQMLNTWNQMPLDLSKNEIFEVVGALAARQVTLAISLTESPNLWNEHAAPIILRAMVDLHITLAWILIDPLDRSQKFICFGLGQSKLLLEHLKIQMEKDGHNVKNDPTIDAWENWINSQRWTFLTEVNVGSWAEKNTREMAEEAGCIDFYRNDYGLFSGAAHSMWHHVSRYNLQQCKNPLHRYHRVPHTSELGSDTAYFILSAAYLQKSLHLIEDCFSLGSQQENAYNWLSSKILKLQEIEATVENK